MVVQDCVWCCRATAQPSAVGDEYASVRPDSGCVRRHCGAFVQNGHFCVVSSTFGVSLATLSVVSTEFGLGSDNLDKLACLSVCCPLAAWLGYKALLKQSSWVILVPLPKATFSARLWPIFWPIPSQLRPNPGQLAELGSFLPQVGRSSAHV